MSLRTFHIFFIVVALGFLAFMVYWSGQRVLHGENHFSWALAMSSAGGLLIGVPYLGWFIRKTKNL